MKRTYNNTLGDEPANLSKRRPVVVVTGLLFLTAFSYFGYAIVSSQIAQTRAAEIFQPAEAVVLSTEVSSHSAGRLSGNSNRSYDVMIKYHYSVGHHDYLSHRYAYMRSGFKDYYAAKKTAERYPAGDRITIYYDPDNPADAVIFKGSPGLSPAILAFPFVLFALIGLLLFIHGLRRTPAK